MMEENVVSAAGTIYCITEAYLCHLIRNAGYTPVQRDNRYEFLKVHDGEDAPDKQVDDWSTQREKKLHIEEAGQTEDDGAVQLTVIDTSVYTIHFRLG